METPTSDEKIMAALAHASVLLSFLGPIGPTLIWAFQRTKSKYVRYHALQAMGYQSLLFWIWIIGIFVVVFGAVFLMVILEVIFMDSTSSDMPFAPFIMQPIIVLGMFGLWGVFFIIGVIGAVFCIMGRDFNYPVIGTWLKKKVFSDQITEAESEEWESGWVGGVCHATAILQLWGIFTPLLVWVLQKDRSEKLRFQALQATIYQLISFIVYMAAMMAYMAIIFMAIAGISILGMTDPTLANGGDAPQGMGIFMIVFIGVIMIFWTLLMIATPIYYIMAAIASILTIRGKNFKYPILGALLTKQMNKAKKNIALTS